MDINILLYDEFETLDAFGPTEILGEVEDFSLNFYSPNGGEVKSAHGVRVMTAPLAEIQSEGVLFIPGGYGARALMQDKAFLARLRALAEDACCCLTVCTGSALLAKTGVLDMKKATTNKQLFDWVAENNADVNWQRSARWVTDGKFYTSSGVTAGMDMTLGFVSDSVNMDKAYQIAAYIEYVWNPDPGDDPFAV